MAAEKRLSIAMPFGLTALRLCQWRCRKNQLLVGLEHSPEDESEWLFVWGLILFQGTQSTCEVMTFSQWYHIHFTLWCHHCDITSMSQGPHTVRDHTVTKYWCAHHTACTVYRMLIILQSSAFSQDSDRRSQHSQMRFGQVSAVLLFMLARASGVAS